MILPIYKIINGRYFTETLYTELMVNKVNDSELHNFCNDNNLIKSKSNENVLICKFTLEPKYYIK